MGHMSNRGIKKLYLIYKNFILHTNIYAQLRFRVFPCNSTIHQTSTCDNRYCFLTQAKAKVHFQQNRETILELWEELEINSNESEFPGIADHKAEDIFVLSKENLQQLKEHSYQVTTVLSILFLCVNNSRCFCVEKLMHKHVRLFEDNLN